MEDLLAAGDKGVSGRRLDRFQQVDSGREYSLPVIVIVSTLPGVQAQSKVSCNLCTFFPACVKRCADCEGQVNTKTRHWNAILQWLRGSQFNFDPVVGSAGHKRFCRLGLCPAG